MGALSAVLSRFSMSAGVFYTGNLCGIATFDDAGARIGHLHLLRSGALTILLDDGKTLRLEKPSLIFFPRPTRHRLLAQESDRADLVCASVEYGTGINNPLANALPSSLVLPLDGLGKLGLTVEWLFEEAFSSSSGRQALMDRLCEVLMIQLLRYVAEQGLVGMGLLAALAHPQISKSIVAMHTHPERPWTLEELAELAGMSRSKFAALFRDTVGQAPGDYLIEWRVGVAQGLLKKGRPVKVVANDVGYENASALARIFRKKVGLSPREWLESVQSAGS